MANYLKELKGQKFGMMEVIGFSHTNKNGSYWICQCDCGKQKTVMRRSLIAGHTKSCGCKGSTLTNNAMINIVQADYKGRCKVKGFEFSLTREKFSELIQSPCSYCGATESNTKMEGGRAFKYNGIDRVDSNLGYTENNTVTCCRFCNIAKASYTKEEFLSHIKRVSNYQEQLV